MVVIIVILVFVSILSGMALSIWAFGTGSKRAKIFEDIYFSVEDVENKGIIYTKKGDYSAVLEMENPIKKYSADTDSYYDFTTLMASVIQVLGEGYALHKQDVFFRKSSLLLAFYFYNHGLQRIWRCQTVSIQRIRCPWLNECDWHPH